MPNHEDHENDLPTPAEATADLIESGRRFYSRGWVLGTSGNFSAVIQRRPPTLLVTASGLDKGSLTDKDFLEVTPESIVPVSGPKPSAELALHWAIILATSAQSVLHTHSVSATLLTTWLASDSGVMIRDHEMLKGLSGVGTHDHHEWVPIVGNSQDYNSLAQEFRKLLSETPGIHGILLRRHGLYTWGASIEEARRHVEIFEFLFDVLARELAVKTR